MLHCHCYFNFILLFYEKTNFGNGSCAFDGDKYFCKCGFCAGVGWRKYAYRSQKNNRRKYHAFCGASNSRNSLADGQRGNVEIFAFWNKPVSDYANPTTCGNIDTSPLISNNSRLEAQRRLVEEFIKNQNKNSQNQSHNSTEKRLSLADYRAFGEEIKFLNSFEKRDKTIGNWTQFLTSVNDFLKKYPNLPERTKTQLVMMGFGSNLKISHDQFKRIIAAHRLDEIQKISDKSNHLSDDEIVHLATFLLPDSKINIVRKNTTQNSAQFLNNITFNPISKDGKLLDVADFNIELRNAPNWVTLDNTNTISNSFNLKIHENNINFNENFSKEFQIILTNKKTGKVFMETIALNVLDYESTDNVLLFSIPQLTLELFKFTTSN